MLTTAIALALVQAASVAQPVVGVRNPAFAADGRLAVSVRGDLWIVSPDGRWSHITSGPEWDREPAWSRDGKSLTYSSNKSGNFDIWQVAASAGATPTRVIATADAESEPSMDDAGRILFVRGSAGESRIWVREPDGREHRLTNGRASERWPSLSPDGRRVAYVIVTETARISSCAWSVHRVMRGAPTVPSSRSGASSIPHGRPPVTGSRTRLVVRGPVCS